MLEILACVDGSSFTESVCDHAAWLAGRTGGRVRILHASEDESPATFRSADALTFHAVQRLQNDGLLGVTAKHATGGIVDAAHASGADIIVMGKRGLAAEKDRRALGRHVESMVRKTSVPLCLTPKLFMPIYRALVVVDADMDRREAVEFVASQRDLSGIACDLIVITPPGQSPDDKVAWARTELSAHDVEVMPIKAEGTNQAVASYMASRRTDIVVLSRAVLLPDQDVHLHKTERGGLWSWRTPVIIC